MLLELLEWTTMAIIFIVFATQVLVPLWRGTALFPILKKEVKLQEKLAEEKQVTLEEKIEKEIEKEKTRRP